MEPEEAFMWAEEAVGFVVRKVRPELVNRWRAVTPQNIGLNDDDWLKMSLRMVARFNKNSKLSISISEPTRREYHSKRFIQFATAIADEAV